MTSKVKSQIEEGNTLALETWLTNTKQTIKEQKSLRPLVGAEEGLPRILLPADLEIAGFYPVKTTGNGDCLFNAACIGIAGKITLVNIPTRLEISSCLVFFIIHSFIRNRMRKGTHSRF